MFIISCLFPLGIVGQDQDLLVGAAQNLALPTELVEATQGHPGNKIAIHDQRVLAEKDLFPDHALNLVQNQGSLLPSPDLAQGHQEIETPNHALALPDREGHQALTEIEEMVGSPETLVTSKKTTMCMTMAQMIKVPSCVFSFECYAVITVLKYSFPGFAAVLEKGT